LWHRNERILTRRVALFWTANPKLGADTLTFCDSTNALMKREATIGFQIPKTISLRGGKSRLSSFPRALA
jgi:hypothetical protein